MHQDFPGGSDICLQCWRPGFNPWVRKISWRRKWQPTPVFLPGKFHGQRSLVVYSPWGLKESDTTEQLHFHFQLMDRSWIGWHQVSFKPYQPSGFNQSKVCVLVVSIFHLEGSASYKHDLQVCVRHLSVSFRELEVWWFCYVAEL